VQAKLPDRKTYICKTYVYLRLPTLRLLTAKGINFLNRCLRAIAFCIYDELLLQNIVFTEEHANQREKLAQSRLAIDLFSALDL
jgi:hypothetical protein